MANEQPLHVPAGADWREPEKTLTVTQLRELAVGFGVYLTSELPEMKDVQPQCIGAAYTRYIQRVANGDFAAFVGEEG